LALSQAEVAELRMLLAEKHQAAIDVLMVARDESLGHLEGGDIRRAAARARDEIDQMILSTLGQDRYAIFKEFENSLPHRATVEQLERRLSYTEAPMAPEQVEAMVNVLATVGGEPAPARPGVSVVVNESDPQVVPLLQSTEPASRITEEVVQLATNVLQPPQVQVLRELQREQELNTWAMWSGSPGGGGARSGASATASSTVFDQDSLLGGIEIQLLLQ
jgi:hypothetical protein